MNTAKQIIKIIVLSVVVVLTIHAITADTFASTCVQINSNLSYDQTDSTTDGPVMMLQKYLQLNGYFSSNPNGHFGLVTLASVKKIQAGNNLAATGYVGPLTRALISQKTCSTVSTVATSHIPTPQSLTPSEPVTPTIVSNTNITAPLTGQVLSTGSTTIVRWNNTPANTYNIILEQPGGVGAGFVAQDQSPYGNVNQYIWNVGKVYSSQSNSNQNVVPGTYRLRLESTNIGATSSDETSGWFTVINRQFSVNSVSPANAYADNTTSVVLFGQGFTTSASVYFDTNYSSYRANNSFVSSDGTVLVFTIPTTVTSGSHTLYINDGLNSTPVQLPLLVSVIK